MIYKQTVSLKNINLDQVCNTFHDRKFVNFLTSFQPIKIISWTGIEDDKIAFFKLWFLGWRDFKVKHSHYTKINDCLSFNDTGNVLPFGLTNWNHNHTVKKDKDNILIIDLLEVKHRNILLGYALFPMLIFPIFIRRILYPLYFYKNKS